jgi:hypothetical protein
VRTGLVGDFSEAKKFSRRFLHNPIISPTVQTIYPMISGGRPTCFTTGHRSKNTRKKKICEKFYLFFQKIQQIRNRDWYDASEIDGIDSDGRTQEKIKEKVVASSWRQGANQRRR